MLPSPKPGSKKWPCITGLLVSNGVIFMAGAVLLFGGC